MSEELLQQFSSELRQKLGGRRGWRERIVAESEDHLREAVAQLRRQGLPARTAWRQALAQFGSAEAIAAAAQAELGESEMLWPEMGRAPQGADLEEFMTRQIMLTLALFTSLLALFVAAHTLWVPEGSIWMIGLKLVSSAAVIAVGALAWMTGHFGNFRLAQSLLLGGMLLLVLGASGVVWTFYLAEVSGDLEAWAIPLNLILMAQGAVTIWHLWDIRGRMTDA